MSANAGRPVMAAAAPGSAASGGPLFLPLTITDPEVLGALAEARDERERHEQALTAMRIGFLSLKAARGSIDGTTVRFEGERLLAALAERLAAHRDGVDRALEGTLRTYFDPASGLFNERVQRLLRADGELANVLSAQLDAARRGLDATLQHHLGAEGELHRLLSPGQGNAFLQAQREQLSEALRRHSAAITDEFTLDRPDSALSRLVREITQRHGSLERAFGEQLAALVAEFSLDDEGSALSRLVGRVEAAQRQISKQFSLDDPESGLTRLVRRIDEFERENTRRALDFEARVAALLESQAVRREQARRSTLHGNEFEQRVGEHLRDSCLGVDETLDSVGATVGFVPRCKVGDFVVELGPDSAAPGAVIVVEAKASSAYTPKSTLEEAQEARRNRGASVCLFVHAARTAPAGLPELHRWGSDLVVIWDEEDPVTDMRLKAAWLAAKAIAVRRPGAGAQGAASLREIDAAIEAVRRQLAGFEDIQTSARTVISGGEKIIKRATLMAHEIEQRMLSLQQQVQKLGAMAGLSKEGSPADAPTSAA